MSEASGACFESFLEKLQPFGTFQATRAAILTLLILSIPLCFFTSIFSLRAIDYKCVANSPVFLNSTYEQKLTNLTVSTLSPEDECYVFSQFRPLEQSGEVDRANPVHDDDTKTPCPAFDIFHKSENERTATQEFGIFCENLHYKQTSSSLLFVGMLVGLFIGAQVGDISGRKPLLVIFEVLTIAITVGTAFVPNLLFFMASRFAVGFSVSLLYAYLFTMLCEMLQPYHIMVMACVEEAAYGVGIAALSGVAFVITDWRQLQLVVASITAIPVLLMILFVPESLRWLVSKGKFKQAQKQAMYIAKCNKVTYSTELDAQLQTLCVSLSGGEREKSSFDADNEGPKKELSTVVQLFGNRLLASRVLILAFCIAVISAVYFGISIGGSIIPGNLYVNTAFGGILEVPAMIFAYFVSVRLGRKKVFVGSLIFTGISCASITITAGWGCQLGSQILALFGKICISISFGIAFLYAAEIIPTCVRATGISFCTLVSRIATIVTPYSLLLSEEIWEPLTFLLFGILAIAGGLMALLLPETHNQPLPDSINDASEDTTSNPKSETSSSDGIVLKIKTPNDADPDYSSGSREHDHDSSIA
ncbi:solute carrier family 22 member 15-like [Convolutriloba macropyga]|uniref:solute carrier family 22 member 15-like n=1 Tax=Convolutriloba macropyga TaxID=536237 RepID=UPI003F527806